MAGPSFSSKCSCTVGRVSSNSACPSISCNDQTSNQCQQDNVLSSWQVLHKNITNLNRVVLTGKEDNDYSQKLIWGLWYVPSLEYLANNLRSHLFSEDLSHMAAVSGLNKFHCVADGPLKWILVQKKRCGCSWAGYACFWCWRTACHRRLVELQQDSILTIRILYSFKKADYNN